MVTLLAARLGVPLDAADGGLAAALMAGIVMDTSTFAHPNVTPRTLQVAAALVEAGAPLAEISRRLYRTKPDRPAAPVRAGPRAARGRPTPAGSSGRPCSKRTWPRPARCPADSEGIIDLLAQAEAAEVAIVFKEAPGETRISVRTEPGGVDATVLTGAFGGGGHARAAGATIAPGPRTRPGWRSWPRRAGWRPASPDERPGPASPGATRLDGILVVDKPAGPTSHDIVGLVRRLSGVKRVGHGGTLDPFARGVLPIFIGRATRVVEYHLGDRKQYRATVCFGATSTTDDLEGELTPVAGSGRSIVPAARRGPRCLSRPDRPGAAGLLGDQGGRPACLRPGPGRRHGPSSRRARSTIDRLEVLDWDASDPERPIAIVEVDCSAGTYIRAIARDLGAGPRAAAPTWAP